MNKKTIRIYLISFGTLAAIVFAGLLIRSYKSSTEWIDLEINGQVGDFVHIGKSIFIEVDNLWVEVLYSSYFERNNPNGCRFIKNKGERCYSINCGKNLCNIRVSSKGGIVEDKTWLRKIDMALKKKEKQMNR